MSAVGIADPIAITNMSAIEPNNSLMEHHNDYEKQG